MNRFRAAAVDIFSRPALYWVLAAIFGLRVVVLSALSHKPDAEGMWAGARAYVTDPAHMYEPAAAVLAQYHVIAPPGHLDAFVSPPSVAVLALPVAWLPQNIAVDAWTVIDALALVGGLIALQRTLASKSPLARAVFWFVAAYFPPLFADVSAGQRGGIALLGAAISIGLEARSPALAGLAGGLTATLKYYPAAMVIGPGPAHRLRYALALGAALIVVSAATFIPLGWGGPAYYVEHILIPSLSSHNPDCAYDSVRTLFTRLVGGETFYLPGAKVTLPIHQPALASVLTYASALAFAGGAVWAAWRSGWNAAYGMSLGFALGALIPSEVWPYQWLPLLPLVLLLVVRAIERRSTRTLVWLGVLMLGFFRQPCDLFFPNIWTIAAIGMFVLGVWENRLFRELGVSEGVDDGAQL